MPNSKASAAASPSTSPVPSAADQIDARIQSLTDWRGPMLAQLRK